MAPPADLRETIRERRTKKSHKEATNREDYYLAPDQIKEGIVALKKYVKKRSEAKANQGKKPKNLLEAGEENSLKSSKVLVEVVFKNVPANSKTFIHTIQLPHHWRLSLGPEDYDIALFVPHRRADSEAQAIQFAKDRDLDIDNTHSYYKELFDEKLDESIRSRISRIITTKELATEFGTFQKLDRLSKTYNLFLSDKKLMANKMNSVPRRLGRRFWVREKKVPLMIKLDAKNLNERFLKALSTEPFYITGRSSTERIQIGVLSQKTHQLVENVETFLKKLHDLYGNCVRFIRFRSNSGLSLPIFADFSLECPEVVMKRKRIKPKPVVDEFDFLGDDVKISVKPSGEVKVIRPKNGEHALDDKSKRKAQESPANEKQKKRIKK